MKSALKKMAIEHLIKGHAAQRQKAQFTDRQSKTLETTVASPICLEKPSLVPGVMATNIINAKYALLQEDGDSRAHIHCWPLVFQAAPIWENIMDLLSVSFILCPLLLSIPAKG